MNKFSFIFLVSILFFSCDDSGLDVEVESSISTASYWSSSDDVNAYLYGCYDDFRDINNSTLLFEDRSDAFKPGDIGPTTEAWSQAMDAQSAPTLTGMYNAIYHFNSLYKQASNFNFSNSSERDDILAQALLMRAHTYFTLVKTFGDTPLLISPYEGTGTEIIGRTPKAEVMSQIISDIDNAISLFSSDNIINKNFWSKPAAFALKADVLLWRGKVLDGGESDLKMVVEVIDNVESITSLPLLQDYSSIFNSSNKKNDEIIFSLYFDRFESPRQYGSRTKSVLQNVSEAYNKSDLSLTAGNEARHVYAPSDVLLAIYEKNDGDLRKDFNIVYPKIAVSEIEVPVDQYDGSQGPNIGLAENGNVRVATESRNLFRMTKKYSGTYYNDIQDYRYDDDTIIYRSADLILMRAEANAGIGNISEAIGDLNKIRNRSGISDYNGSQDKISVENEILDERFRELFLELKRWHDLVRAHEWGSLDIYQKIPNLVGKSVPLNFPISNSDIAKNSLLIQNQGY